MQTKKQLQISTNKLDKDKMKLDKNKPKIDEGKINLVLSCDQNYIKLLVPCIISILYNKKPTTAIDIYILQSGINDYHQQKIKELTNGIKHKQSANGVNPNLANCRQSTAKSKYGQTETYKTQLQVSTTKLSKNIAQLRSDKMKLNKGKPLIT